MALVAWRTGTWKLQIVKRSDAAGFEVLPKRWIVERTFAWISRNRRLARGPMLSILCVPSGFAQVWSTPRVPNRVRNSGSLK